MLTSSRSEGAALTVPPVSGSSSPFTVTLRIAPSGPSFFQPTIVNSVYSSVGMISSSARAVTGHRLSTRQRTVRKNAAFRMNFIDNTPPLSF